MTLLTALRTAAACGLLLAARAAPAAEATYALDPVHTRVMFAVGHAGFSDPMFTIAGTTGTLVFDPADWSTARVEARIPVAGLELGEGKWRSAILGRNFFDAARFPEIRFVSTHVEPVDATHAKVFGRLTLRDVTREVQLDVVMHQVRRHPLPPFRRTAGFSATGTLRREAFGMTAWQNVVGDTVEIRIEAEGTRSRGGDGEAEDARMPAPAPASTTSPAPAGSIILPAEFSVPESEPTTPP
jgi:polyisoprenoid-binding protein YceI